MTKTLRKPLDIDRAAWCLIRRYGDESAKVAYLRAQNRLLCSDSDAVNEWKLVIDKIVELHFTARSGPLH